MDPKTLEYEFLRPLCTAWLAKLETARQSRSRWDEIAKECMMFYSQSAAAMWSPQYAKKFWKGTKLPRFRVTINKAFEMVAIYGPNLMWEYPHRTVEPKKQFEIPPEFLQVMPEGQQQIVQQLQMQQMVSSATDKATAKMLDLWLNYTPREQPDGGLAGHSKRAILDSLIKGRGVLAARPYRMPGSEQTLTGLFHVKPEDVLIDSDFDCVGDAKWIAIRHTESSRDVEERFSLPRRSLSNRSTLESSWRHSELSTDGISDSNRVQGKTGDLVVWWEIFSKGGVGCSHTAMETPIRDHLDTVVGKYAYIAICENVPYPLNLPTEKIRAGATDSNVKEAMTWPIPFWKDDEWPVQFLDYYDDPTSAWPIAPLAPGLGELKLLNFLVSWMANRVWSSSRDFWAVAGQHVEHYRQYLEDGDDLAVIPTPLGTEDVHKAVQMLTQPETRGDLSRLIEFVSGMFDKRVGLTPMLYGMNQDGTQNRTAEETVAKSRAVQARPEFMQKQVVDWQSRAARAEAFVAGTFVTARDVAPVLGPAGSMMWQMLIEPKTVEGLAREFDYTVAATSIRRPDRDRDLANYQQVMQYFLAVVQAYGQQSGNYGPFNFLMQKWGDFHDADLSGAMIPQPEEPTEEEQQMQQQAQMLELQEAQAKVQKLSAEAQKIASEVEAAAQQAQLAMQLEQIRAQREQAKSQGEIAKVQLSMQAEQARAQSQMAKAQVDQQSEIIDMIQGLEQHQQEMVQDQEVHDQEIDQSEEMHEQKLRHSKELASIQKRKANNAED